MNNFLFSFFMFISSISYASFPIINNTDIVSFNNTNDPFNTIGWIVLSCLALGGILVALQFIIDPHAYIAGYFIVGYIVASVGALLGLVWLFSRFKWGRKYWWALLLGLFLIQIILEQYGLA